MNPAEQQDFEDVFGPDAVRHRHRKRRKLSDRRAEGWARRHGGVLPDMRKGRKPTGSKFVTLPNNPLGSDKGRGDDGDDSSGPSVFDLEPMAECGIHPKARAGGRSASVYPTVTREVATVGGGKVRTPMTLTADEYIEREADKTPAVHRTGDIVPRLRLRLPISSEVPKRYQETDALLKEWCADTILNPRRGSLSIEDLIPIADEDIEYVWTEPVELELCTHCAVDPAQTKRDGLCRNCKTYRTTHQGDLPPANLIESRKRKRGNA